MYFISLILTKLQRFIEDKYNLFLFRIVLNKCIFINISC